YITTLAFGSLFIYQYTNPFQKVYTFYQQADQNSPKQQEKDQFNENDIEVPTSKLQGIIKSSDLIVFAGSGNKELAKEIVSHLDITLGRFSIHKNPETELQMELLDSVRGKRVYIIQSMCQPIHDNIMELFLMCSTLKRSGASKVTCIIPYFAYSRQTSQEYGKDRKSLAGSDICLMLEQMGCDQIVTINHNQQEVKGFFSPRTPLLNIDVNEMVVPYLLEKQVKNPVLISSHIKARSVKRIVQLQKAFKEFEVETGIGFMEKYVMGTNDEGVSFEYIGDEVQGKDCKKIYKKKKNVKNIQIRKNMRQ
ncbi:phosphoribosylpyrophosphate synthetase, putative, partial [Ichthyophthirius multifiliis]